MRWRSSGDTALGLRNARETVIGLTFASLATSSSVFRFFGMPAPDDNKKVYSNAIAPENTKFNTFDSAVICDKDMAPAE
jgi:hypothetical protein